MTDDWNNFIAPINPIKEAHDCGDNIPFEVYSRQPDGVKRGHPDYILSGSDLAEFALCPHRWVSGYRDEQTRATEWGQLVDCLLMDPDSLEDRFAIAPETYLTDKGEQKPWNFNATVCKEWKAEKEEKGLAIIKSGLLAKAREAAQLLNDDPHLAEVFRSSRKQVMITGIYDDEATGLRIPLRCLIDLAPPAAFLADLKTATSAHPKSWTRHLYDYGYHEQAARHLDLWNAAHGECRQEFRHYVQESFEPYEIGKRILSHEFIGLGRDRYLSALKRYAQCLKAGEWPGYDCESRTGDIVIDGHLVVTPEAWMAA